jgi:hypothetical protein
MVAIFRLFLKLIKQEHHLVSRYKKSHPHFFWYVGLDAAISIALVVGGFQIAHAGSSWKAAYLKVQDTGVKALSADQVIDRVRGGNLKAYWLGRISGALYSFELKQGTVSTLTYLVGGSGDLQDVALPKLVIRTFDSYRAYAANIHPVLAPSAESIVENPNYTLQFDSNFMQTVTIVFKYSPQVVVINYPETHPKSSIIEDASEIILL